MTIEYAVPLFKATTSLLLRQSTIDGKSVLSSKLKAAYAYIHTSGIYRRKMGKSRCFPLGIHDTEFLC